MLSHKGPVEVGKILPIAGAATTSKSLFTLSNTIGFSIDTLFPLKTVLIVPVKRIGRLVEPSLVLPEPVYL